MNPRASDELRRLTLNLDKLTAAIRHAVEETEQARIEREKLLQEQWRLQREAATNRRAASDYHILLTEHEALKDAASDVKNSLHAIREWSKMAKKEMTS